MYDTRTDTSIDELDFDTPEQSCDWCDKSATLRWSSECGKHGLCCAQCWADYIKYAMLTIMRGKTLYCPGVRRIVNPLTHVMAQPIAA